MKHPCRWGLLEVSRRAQDGLISEQTSNHIRDPCELRYIPQLRHPGLSSEPSWALREWREWAATWQALGNASEAFDAFDAAVGKATKLSKASLGCESLVVYTYDLRYGLETLNFGATPSEASEVTHTLHGISSALHLFVYSFICNSINLPTCLVVSRSRALSLPIHIYIYIYICTYM